MIDTLERIIKPHLSVIANISFTASFIIARIFTTLNPSVVVLTGGFHIHHFWYGLAMLVVGGWMGISYQAERIDRLAAVLFGGGGGLIADEVGLLLTFGNYWVEATYTYVVIFITFVTMGILLKLFWKPVRKEFSGFLRNHGSLYFGIFLAAISSSFILETDNPLIQSVLISLTGFASLIILLYFALRYRRTGKIF